MFKQSKLTVAIAMSVATLSWGIANAATAPIPDYDGSALTDNSGANGTVSDVQPKFVFHYNPAMSGVLIDLTEGLDASDASVDKASNITKCGDNVTFEYVPLTDMNCTSAGCEWLPPKPLVNGSSYYIVGQEVVNGVVATTSRGACKEGAGNAGVAFTVDTSTATPPPAPTMPPEKVVIAPAATGKCTSGPGTNCKIIFTHPNTPAASHYRVWINDKNGIQIDEDALSAKADQSVDLNGWFEVNTAGAVGAGKAAVTCAADLAGTRTCELEIDKGHSVFNSMQAGSPVRVWVRAWNAKGYAPWSDSEVFEVQ